MPTVVEKWPFLGLIGLMHCFGCSSPDATEDDSTLTETSTSSTGHDSESGEESGGVEADMGPGQESGDGDGDGDAGEPLPELIAYTSNELSGPRELRVTERSGANVTTLSAGPGNASRFDWSPNGRDIAVISREPNPSPDTDDLYLVEVDAGEVVRLTDDSMSEDRLRWSPLGHEIAFSAGPDGFRGLELFVIDVETHAIEQLTDLGGADELSFDWSPDGEQLVVAVIAQESARLLLVARDGSGSSTLIDQGPFPELRDPAWSPTGEWIAFSGRPEFLAMNYLIHPDGNDLAVISEEFGDQPRWSPEGDKVVVRGHDGESFRIGVLDLGGAPTLFVEPDTIDHCWAPRWSATGSHLAYDCDVDGLASVIRVRDLEAGIASTIVNDGLSNGSPAWRPNSVP